VSHPLRIRREHWRAILPPGAKLVARPSAWHNPFWDPKGHPDRTRAEAVEMFERYLIDRPWLITQLRAELAGRQLACYCPLDEPCHADVLARLANEERP